MKKLILFIPFFLLVCSTPPNKKNSSSIPDFIIGEFEDDYGVSYSISDSLFEMENHTKIHILEWNNEKQFFVGQNDSLNIYDPLRFSRIDWMKFQNMDSYKWGFCMSAYNEVTLDSAKAVNTADRTIPKTGCGGYPFSRMKRVENEG